MLARLRAGSEDIESCAVGGDTPLTTAQRGLRRCMRSATLATKPSPLPHLSRSGGGRGLGRDDRGARPDRGAEDDSTPGAAAAPLGVAVRKPTPHSALLLITGSLRANGSSDPLQAVSLSLSVSLCLSLSPCLCVSRSPTPRLGRLCCRTGALCTRLLRLRHALAEPFPEVAQRLA